MWSLRRRAAIVFASACSIAAVACSLTSLDEFTCHGAACSSVEGGPDAVATDGPPDSFRSDAAPPDDDLGNGDGHFGKKTVFDTEIVNAYLALTADVPAGASTIDLEAAGPLTAGDAVLVWQTVSDQPIASATKIDLAGYVAGTYEIVRVKSVTAASAADTGTAARIELVRPVAHPFRAMGAQVVRIAEYTDLTVEAAGKLTAAAWDGRRGGIVIVFVNGTMQIDGAVDADSLGLRGGVSYMAQILYQCGAKTDGIPFAGFAAKGEGLVSMSYRAAGDGDPRSAPGGRGNSTNGGGGGNCHNAGGGGGGNGGGGGAGGREYSGTGDGGAFGGLGGSALFYSVKERLILGGGGGAGERHQEVDTTGAPGGGAVFVRARSLNVGGEIRANGGSAGPTNHDGAGGGGAGGTIALFVTESATCAKPIRANGGSGGSTTMSCVGPGGGGGGGHGYLQPANGGCSFEVKSGIAGVQANGAALDGPHYGATPDVPADGVIEIP